MKRTVLRALIITTATAAAASSAYASGYGPAPFYRPYVGAPASQQGQNSQTLSAERMNIRTSEAADVGGVAALTSESGGDMPSSSHVWIYRHH